MVRVHVEETIPSPTPPTPPPPPPHHHHTTSTILLLLLLLHTQAMSDCTDTPQEYADCDLCKTIDGFGAMNRLGLKFQQKSNRYLVPRDIFHSQCARCSSLEFTESCLLCSFCCHLRIPHLVVCLDQTVADMKNMRLGSFKEVRDRGSICDFCRFASTAIWGKMRVSRVAEDVLPDTIVRLNFGKDGVVTLNAKPINPSSMVIVDVTIWNCEKTPGIDSKFRLGEYVDWDRVRNWVESTENSRQTQPPKNLTVIDVQQNRVIEAPAGCEYLALSYTWGSPKTRKKWDLPKYGSTFDRNGLPRTIRDAVFACISIGMRFLWVDQLCLDQDDKDGMQEQVNQMNLVYESARCTIVAMAGEDFGYGLPGVSSPRNWNHSVFEMGNLTFASNAPSLKEIYSSSIWSTRGWTFQETIFSSTLLCFTDYGVHCAHCHNSNNFRLKWTLDSESACRITNCLPSPEGYGDLLCQYTRRNLSDGYDVLPAFTPTLRSRYGHLTSFGLPLRAFELALLWCQVYDNSASYSKRDQYPSWSWVSHAGPVQNLTTKGNLVYWSYPTSLTKTELFGDNLFGTQSDGNSKWKRWFATLMALIWRTGCMEMRLPFEPELDPATFEAMENLWPTYRAYWEYNFGRFNDSDIFAPQDLETAAAAPSRILARGQTAHFHLKASTTTEEPCLRQDKYWILSDNGTFSGLIQIPDYHQIPEEGYLGEFMVLSIGAPVGWSMSDEYCRWIKIQKKRSSVDSIVDFKADGLLYHDVEGKTCPYPDGPLLINKKKAQSAVVLNVMLVGRREGNVACRLGVGRIYLKRWAEAQRQFKTVILE